METLFSRLTSEHDGAEALRLELAPGLNVLRGPGEMLSAIPEAMGEALCGEPARALTSVGGRGSSEASRVELEGESGGNAWHILRLPERPVIALQSGRKIDPEQLDARMEAWIGADLRYYLRVGLALGETRDATGDIEDLVIPALAELVGKESLDRLREIDTRLDILVRGRATGHGEPGLPDVERAIAALGEHIDAASQDVERFKSLQANLEQVEADIARCEERAEQIQALLDAGSSWNRSRKEFEQLEQQLDFLRRIGDTLEHQADVDRQQQQPGAGCSETRDAIREIEDLQQENREAEEESRRLSANLRVSRAGSGPLKRAGAPIVLTGALLLIGGFLGSFFNIYLVFVCFSGLPVVIFGLSRMQRFHEMSIDVGESSTARQLRRLEARSRQRDARIDKLLKRLNCRDIEELEALAQIVGNLGTDGEIIQSRLDLLPASITPANLEEEMARLAQQVEERRSDLDSDTSSRPPLDEVETLVSEYKELKEEREKLDAARRRALVSIAELEERSEGPLRLETRRTRLEKARDETVREIERLRSESEGVENKLGEQVAEAVVRLEERIGRILEQLSGGVYRRVSFGEEASSLELYSEFRGEFIAPAEAGEGVARGVWLALRMALYEAIFGRNNPPLLLREPLEGLGEAAAQQGMQLLREASRVRQTLILTSDDIYDIYADRLLEVS